MSLRTFTVFQDAPSIETSTVKALTITSIPLSSKLVILNHATTLTTDEKENLHPLTGERAGLNSNSNKKRKTSVLSTKAGMPLAAKKQKESKEDNPDAKKRKSSSTVTVKGKLGAKKDGKSTSSARKGTKRLSRKISPMPKLDEEAEADRERDRITQAGIDSRCYELTVQPLADVSRAYDQGSTFESNEETTKFQSVKASSVEPEIRDYFSSPAESAALPGGSATMLSMPSLEGRSFSTPERKKIYAAFTFTSPSPTSDRFNKATRANSIPPLELV